MDQFQVIFQNYARQKLPNKYLEKDIQAFYLPLNIPFIVMFQSKYIITNNFISHHGYVYKIISLIFNLMIAVITYFFNGFYHNSFIDLLNYFLITSSLFFLLYANIHNGAYDLKTISRIQSVRRSLIYCKHNIRSLVITNWIWFFLISLYFIVADSLAVLYLKFSVIIVLMDAVAIFADFAIIYCIRTMILMGNCLSLWIEESRICKLLAKFNSKDGDICSNDWNSMDEAYRVLVGAVSVYRTCLSMPVFVYVSLSFFQILITFATYIAATGTDIDWFTSNRNLTLDGVILLLWDLKAVILIWILGIECEKFNALVQSLNVECLMVLSTGKCSDHQKKICKNVLRLNRISFKEFTVYSMFTVGGSLGLNFLNILGPFMFLILQYHSFFISIFDNLGDVVPTLDFSVSPDPRNQVQSPDG